MVVEIDPGEKVTVVAYPLFDFYTYDVYSNLWWSSKKVGYGVTGKCTGFCTVIY